MKLTQLANRIDDVLSSLSDYDRINIDKFYNDENNTELLNSLDRVLKNSLPVREIDQTNIIDLYSELDSFIQFETEYNSQIGDF